VQAQSWERRLTGGRDYDRETSPAVTVESRGWAACHGTEQEIEPVDSPASRSERRTELNQPLGGENQWKKEERETRPWWRRPLPALRLTEKWQQGQKLNRAIRENEIGLSEEQNLAKLNRALVAATLAGADTHVRK
jgi:hypothetical protein